jgi:hypothetical protein
LLAHGRWFSLCTPASSTAKPSHHDIAERGIKHQKSNHQIDHVSVLINLLFIQGDLVLEFYLNRPWIVSYEQRNICNSFTDWFHWTIRMLSNGHVTDRHVQTKNQPMFCLLKTSLLLIKVQVRQSATVLDWNKTKTKNKTKKKLIVLSDFSLKIAIWSNVTTLCPAWPSPWYLGLTIYTKTNKTFGYNVLKPLGHQCLLATCNWQPMSLNHTCH